MRVNFISYPRQYLILHFTLEIELETEINKIYNSITTIIGFKILRNIEHTFCQEKKG
jgi:hypothetical protein